jgi:hypothetical protein
MGKRREQQQALFVATKDVIGGSGNAFYDRPNEILGEHKFDRKVEALCRRFYQTDKRGRPSMAPGVYFRLLLIGYFEGLDSERGHRLARGRFTLAAKLFWVSHWMSIRRTTRPYRGPVDCTRCQRQKRCSVSAGIKCHYSRRFCS